MFIRTYPSWQGTQHSSEHSINTTTPEDCSPDTPQVIYLHTSHSDPTLGSPSKSMVPSTAMPALSSLHRPQYQYPATPQPTSPAGHVGRFLDSNPRPSKSPRHGTPPQLPAVSYTDYGVTRYEPSYPASSGVGPQLLASPLSQVQLQERGFFPVANTIPMQAWTTATDAVGLYGASLPSNNSAQYGLAPDQYYVKQENPSQQHYTWNPV